MKILLIVFSLIFAIMPTASAAVYQQGIVYVIYDETGAASVKDKSDKNSNGVPDVVEDMATQVNAARELFKNVFKFPDPLASERFRNVTSIEIDIAGGADMNGHNGFSFSGIRKKAKHNPNEQAIHMRVANTVDPRINSTPAHEYFHLLQYGATYFRNKWFFEGMARWAQDSVTKVKYPEDKNFSSRLNDKFANEKIFPNQYKVAGILWYPLAVNMKDKAKIPDSLIKKYRYADGSPVFQDNIIYGPNVMREVMATMKSKENIAAAEYGGMEKWRKDGQRAALNNKIMLDCVKEVYNSKK